MPADIAQFRSADRLLADQEARPEYAALLGDLAGLATVVYTPPEDLFDRVADQLDLVDRRRSTRRVAVSLAAAGAIVLAGRRPWVA